MQYNSLKNSLSKTDLESAIISADGIIRLSASGGMGIFDVYNQY
jgi:hypothetical protein